MKNMKIILVGTCFLLCFVSIFAWYFSRKRPNYSYKILHFSSTKANVPMAFELMSSTDEQIVLEGGTYGGILAEQALDRKFTTLPSLGSQLPPFHPGKEIAIWAYNFTPSSVEKEDNWPGDGFLYLHGKRQNTNTVYLVVVPKRFAIQSGSIICKED